MTDHVLDHEEALALLLDLEERGVEIELDGEDVLLGPGSAVTSQDRTEVQRHKATFVQLVRIADEGVQTRLAAFKDQKPSTDPRLIPGFRYVAGVCFSCGERCQDRTRWGRCWRCALALRLAWNCPIPSHPEEVPLPESTRHQQLDLEAGGQAAATPPALVTKGSSS